MQQSSLTLSNPASGANGTGNGPVRGNGGGAIPVIIQYWQVFLRRKWIMIGIIVATLLAGVVITMMVTPKYSASTRIEIARDQKNITNVEGVEPQGGSRDVEFYQTQYSLLRARSLAQRVARTMRLSTNDAFFAANGIKSESSTTFATAAPNRAMSRGDRAAREEQAVGLLLRGIAISEVRGSALVDIKYTSASPEISAAVANAWAEQFIQQSMDRRFASTADARRFLEGRLAELRARLETSERDLVNYAAQKGIVALNRTTDADGRTTVNRTLAASDLEALNTALNAATADRVAAESRANSGGGSGASAEALGNQTIATLRQRRAEVAAEYARILVQFEPEYPSARALSQQLAVLDRSIAREEARVSSSRSTEYREAAQREAGLRARVNALRGQVDAQQRDSIQYNIYQRESDTNRQLYDGMLQRYKEIGVAGVGSNNISIVDPAQVPSAPSSPNLPFNIALALLAGLGLAALATFALEQIDEGLRDPAQVPNLLNMPLLGSIPDISEDPLLEVADAKSHISEAYLSIRSSLAFSTDHGVPRTVLVTSTRPAEGKSTSSYALAMVLGRTGKKVLLIDADMRSPSGHGFFGASNDVGLSNFLAGDNDIDHLLKETSFKGLTFMAAGPMPPSAAELLSGNRMELLLQELMKSFDHIIVDAPPILGLADAPLLSRTVEGCIIVIEAGGVPIRGIKGSIERLQAAQAHLLGAVVTKVRRNQAGYGYGYGYGYGDGLAYGDRDAKTPA